MFGLKIVKKEEWESDIERLKIAAKKLEEYKDKNYNQKYSILKLGNEIKRLTEQLNALNLDECNEKGPWCEGCVYKKTTYANFDIDDISDGTCVLTVDNQIFYCAKKVHLKCQDWTPEK